MPATRVYLLRHGHSTWQTTYDVTQVDPLIPDAPLSDRGKEQVRAVAGEIHALGVDLIVTSPLTRAIETALGVLDPARPAPILVEPLISEWLGDSCDIGRSPADLAGAFPLLDFTRLPEVWWHTGECDDRGIPIEPRDRLAERAAKFRQWLLTRPERVVLVVSHSGFLRQFSGTRLDNCKLYEWNPARPLLLPSPRDVT